MFSFFKRSRKVVSDLEWMYADMHSHLLPGVDDGVATQEKSIEYIERLHALGLQKFYLTPHIFQDMYPNSYETIMPVFTKLKQSSVGELVAGCAAEYMVDNAFDQRLQDPNVDLFTLPGMHVLVEMPYIQESYFLDKSLFDLQVMGCKPILAHPERYVFYHSQPEKIRTWREKGCLLQINMLSLTGYYGVREKQVALWLCEQGLVDLIGTDLHSERHLRSIEKFVQEEDVHMLLRKCQIKNQLLFG